MRKYVLDLTVSSVTHVSSKHILLKLTHQEPLPKMLPGQFVEVKVEGSTSTFLRRPISIHFVDRSKNELWLLVAMVGDGTRQLANLHKGDTLNCLLPLGNGFTQSREKTLLVGGGVGVAPLLYLGHVLCNRGTDVTFLLGARSESDLLELDEFRKYGRVLLTTEDGSLGEQGFVTNHSIWQSETFGQISVCGPKPMMVAVAKAARQHDTPCEVSLENMMACGLGACLCCVEDTQKGHLCVCKDGPVFNINELKWQI